MMIRVIKYLIIGMFLAAMSISVFIMIDNYHLAVEKGVAQTIICEQVASTIQGTSQTKSVETCYTYNPQLLFYGQIAIIIILILSMKYVYNLSVSYIKRYHQRVEEEQKKLGTYFPNKTKSKLKL